MVINLKIPEFVDKYCFDSLIEYIIFLILIASRSKFDQIYRHLPWHPDHFLSDSYFSIC